MKMQSSSPARWLTRSSSTSKISGSGLATPSSPETMMSSKRSRKSNSSSATGNRSADQFVSANSGTSAACSSRRISTLPSIAPTSEAPKWAR